MKKVLCKNFNSMNDMTWFPRENSFKKSPYQEFLFLFRSLHNVTTEHKIFLITLQNYNIEIC